MKLQFTPTTLKEPGIGSRMDLFRSVTPMSFPPNARLVDVDPAEGMIEKARLLMAAIGETTTMVGHDLRNPLQAMTGTLYLAKRGEDFMSQEFKSKKQNGWVMTYVRVSISL
jgi:signal transduction histidine kinase